MATSDDALTLRFRNHSVATTTTTRAPAWQRVTRKIAKTLGASGRTLTSSKRLIAADDAEQKQQTKDAARGEESAVALAPLRRSDTAHADDDDGVGQRRGRQQEPQTHQRDAELLGTAVSHDALAISSAAHRDAARTHLSAIPAAYPLVQYVAECCAVLTQTEPAAAPAPLRPQSAHDVEVALFQTCLRLRKWSLAQTLAVRLERRVVRQAQDEEIRSRHRSGSSDHERIPRGSSALHDDTGDVILRFLDTCASS